MFEVYPTSWPTTLRPQDPREAINAQAIFEARVATDFRGEQREASESILARVRSALSSKTERAADPACCLA